MARRSTRRHGQSPVLEAKRAPKHRESDAFASREDHLTDPRRYKNQIHRNTIQEAARKGFHPKSPRKDSFVSATGFFKKSARAARKSHRHRDKTPGILDNFQDGLEDARSAINKDINYTFHSVHTALNERIKSISQTDQIFFETISHKATLLTAPLTEEKLETEVRRDGKHFHEVVQIGERITAFKKLVDKEDERLTDLWKQWDAVQIEYVRLGCEVLDADAFGDLGAEYRDLSSSYKRELELLDVEHKARVKEIDDEINEISVETMHKMKTTEKQLNAAAKREQARLLQSIMD